MANVKINILGDASSAERAFRRASSTARGFQTSVERAARGSVVASVGFRGLGRSVAFASAQFLGGAGIVYAIKSTIDAAERAQVAVDQTAVAVKNSGNSWVRYGKQIQDVALAQSKLSGFDDERLLGTFSTLVRRTGDVNQALRLNALAADVARGRHVELEQATMLVLKASIGQAGALRRLGIDAKKGASSVELLQLINKKYAGSAEAYGRTAAGAQDRFRVAVENLQEVIGARLLPTITTWLNKGADWLNNTKNQKMIMDRLGQAIGLVKSVIAAATPIVRQLADAAKYLTDKLGGLKNVILLLLGIKFASWLTGISNSASAASGSVGGLYGRLGALAKVGMVSVGVTVLFKSAGDGGAKAVVERILGGALIGGAVGGAPGAVVGGTAAALAPTVAGIANDFAGSGGTTTGAGSGPYWGGEGVGWVDGAGHVIPDQKSAWSTFFRSGNRGRPIVGQSNKQRATPGAIGGRRTYIPPSGASSLAGRTFGPLPGISSMTGLNAPAGSGGGGGDKSSGEELWRKRFQKVLDALSVALSRAQMTDTLKDDLAVLHKEETLIKQQLRLHKGDLDLQQKLVDVQGQMNDLRKQERDQLASTIDTLRGQALPLFGGPILNPSDNDLRARLGLRGPAAGLLTSDLAASNKAFAANQFNLRTLIKRGAPAALISQLREMGMGGAGFISTLAHASGKDLAGLIRQFRIRESQFSKAAKFQINAQSVTVVARSGAGPNRPPDVVLTIDGKEVGRVTAGQGAKRGRNSAWQTRGRWRGYNAGAWGY